MPTHFYAAYGDKTAVHICNQADAEEARQAIERCLKTPIKRTDRRRHEARNALIAAFETDKPDAGMITALTIWLAHGQPTTPIGAAMKSSPTIDLTAATPSA